MEVGKCMNMLTPTQYIWSFLNEVFLEKHFKFRDYKKKDSQRNAPKYNVTCTLQQVNLDLMFNLWNI